MSLEVSNPFPLNIDPKQDSFEKLQLMANVPDSFKVLALEFNTIIEALKYLYANNPNAVEPTAIENEYPTIAAMLADQVNQTPANLQWVADASDDPGIIEGYAYYEKLANSTGTLATDYRRLTADEVIQLETGLIKIEDEIGNSFQTALKIIFGAGFTVQLIPGGGARVFYQGPTNLSEFTNDGEDGINPFVDQSDFPQATQITAATYTLDGDGLNKTNVFVNPVVITIPNDVTPTKKVKSKKTLLSFKSTWTINYPTTDGLSTLAGVAGALVYIERNNIGNEWIVRRVNSFTPNLQQVTDVLPSETNNSVKFKGGITLDTFPGANLQNQLTGANGAGIMLLSFISSGNTIKKIRAILNSGASFDNINFLSLTNSVSDILVLRINGRGVIEAFDATILRIDAANIRTYITKEWFFDKITNAPAEASPDNIITEKAGEIKKTPFGSLFSATAATGGVIDFTLPKIYNSPASPEIGNITDNLTGALIGVVQKVYHNHTVAPAFPIGWVLIGGEYVISSLNIIYCEWVSATRVEYWIAQEI